MMSTRAAAFMPHLFKAIDDRLVHAPRPVVPDAQHGAGVGKHDPSETLNLPTSYIELSSFNSSTIGSAIDPRASMRRTFQSLRQSLTPAEAQELLVLLGRRKSAPLPLVKETKVRKSRVSPKIHTPRLSHHKYLVQLSQPRRVFVRGRSGSQPNIRPRENVMDQNEVCSRLARHRSFEAVIRRYTPHEIHEDSERSDEDWEFPNVPIVQNKSVNLRPYSLGTELLVPKERQHKSLRLPQRIIDHISYLSPSILRSVDIGEKVIPGEFDEWVAEMLSMEVIPSLSKRFPKSDHVVTDSVLFPSAPLTVSCVHQIETYEPNKLLLLRLIEIKNRIDEKIRTFIRSRS